MKNKLPNKPSTLIRVALRDLIAVERNTKTYEVSMGTWHAADKGKCYVCLAGAVMAKSLKTPRTRDAWPFLFPDDTKEKLDALDGFRRGELFEALQGYFKTPFPNGLPMAVDIVDYHVNPRLFKKGMRDLAKLLQKHGL